MESKDILTLEKSIAIEDEINKMMARTPLTSPEVELRYLLLDYNQPLAYQPEFDREKLIWDPTGHLDLGGYLYNSTVLEIY